MKKEFRTQVQQHIADILDGIGTTEEKLLIAVDSFKHYLKNGYHRQPNIQEAFIDWIQGLPSELDVEYTTHGQHELLKQWFETSGQEWKERKDTDTLYWNLIAREFRKMCEKYGYSI